MLDLHESWLKAKAAEIGITDGSGFAIVGNGGLGRREMLPYSDLDLLLLHDGKDPEVLADVADRLWYPLWDANIRLDHSVRTVSEAVGIAGSDMTAALGLLEARHIAGEERAVQRADRWGAATVAHRNSVPDRRTRRDDTGPLAALRPDLQPRRARSEVGPRRPA